MQPLVPEVSWYQVQRTRSLRIWRQCGWMLLGLHRKRLKNIRSKMVKKKKNYIYSDHLLMQQILFLLFPRPGGESRLGMNWKSCLTVCFFQEQLEAHYWDCSGRDHFPFSFSSFLNGKMSLDILGILKMELAHGLLLASRSASKHNETKSKQRNVTNETKSTRVFQWLGL